MSCHIFDWKDEIIWSYIFLLDVFLKPLSYLLRNVYSLLFFAVVIVFTKNI